MNDGFEETATGEPPRGAQISGEEKGASIRISEDRAAQGKRCLKVTDSKELQPSWQPHFFYEPHLRGGSGQQSFDVWMGTNSLMFTEWRDQGPYPHNVGPSVTFDGQGRILVSGKELARVTPGQWVHVEIAAPLGKNAAKKFTLKIAPAVGSAKIFTDLPFPGKAFQELHWLGFSSTAAADAAFFLDNVKVKRE